MRKTVIDSSNNLRRIAMIALIGLISLAVLVNRSSWIQIEKILTRLPLQCPLNRFTGLECAFCGMTHSWISILRFEWSDAVHYNPLGPILFVAFFVLLILSAGKKLPLISAESKRKIMLGAVFVLITFTVLRNIGY
jgi:Protein of unknown function (DUF2752)